MALNPSIRKVPIIGDDIYKIGQIYDIVNTPCSIDPWLWVYGFWHEVPYIFAMLFLPDPIDFVQERFGKPHHRKRRYKGKAAAWAQADISPGKGLGWAAFKMTEWVDRVGWYLLIADTSIQFALNWTTLVYQWSGCPTPGMAFAAQSYSGGIERFPGDWAEAGTEADGAHIFTNLGASRIFVPAGWTGSFTTAMVIKPRGAPYNGQEFQVRIQNLTTGEVIGLDPPKPNHNGEFTASQVVPMPPKRDVGMVYQYQFRNTDGRLDWMTRAIFSGYGTKKVEGLIPWLGKVDF